MTAVLDIRMPAGLDSDGMTPDERRQHETMQAARVQLLLMQRVPMSLPVWRWSVISGVTKVGDPRIGVEGHLGVMPSDHASRAAVMKLAEQFGLDYVEKPHSEGKNSVTATGFYAGVSVRFFDLVEPCPCGCAVTR